MIKVLHIIPNLRRGGAERLVLNICTELQKRVDVNVKLLTFSPVNEYPGHSESIDFETISATLKLSILRRNKAEIFDLQKILEGFEPDIIHTHLFESEIVSRSCNYPDAVWFTHCHDNMVQFRNIGLATFLSKQALTNYYEKRVLLSRYKINGGTHFIAISKDTEAYFKKSAKHYQVTLLPNAIDYQKFYNPCPGKESGDVLRLINIGSFVEKKNQCFLIDVANILKKRSLPFELHLLGDGVKKTELEIKAKNLGLDKELFFHGNVDRVEELLWQSHIYVHSANYEPLGLVLLEAMAAGLPVITLDGIGNRDLIVEGKNGFMLSEPEANKFADKVIEVWENKKLYSEMAAFAQEFAKGYDIKEYVDRLLVIYKQTL